MNKFKFIAEEEMIPKIRQPSKSRCTSCSNHRKTGWVHYCWRTGTSQILAERQVACEFYS